MNIMTPAEIMDTAFDILRENIKSLVLYIIGFTIIASLISFALIVILSILGAVFFGISTLLVQLDFFHLVLIGILIFIVTLFIIALYSTFGIGIIRISAQKFLKNEVDAGRLIKDSLRSVLKVFRILISSTIISIPVFLVLSGLVYLTFYALIRPFGLVDLTFGTEEILALSMAVIIGIVLAFLISVYFIGFSFTLHAAFIEEKGAISSIKRSFQIFKRDFKRIYGYVVLFSFITTAISYSLQGLVFLVAGILFLVMQLLNIQLDYMNFMMSVNSYTNWPLTLMNLLVIGPISSIMTTILYFNQRIQSEGYDISLKLEELENDREKEVEDDSRKG